MPVPEPGAYDSPVEQQDYRDTGRRWVGTSFSPRSKSDLGLHGAVVNAYEQASDSTKGDGEFKIIAIYVIGSNPFSEYRVVLGDA